MNSVLSDVAYSQVYTTYTTTEKIWQNSPQNAKVTGSSSYHDQYFSLRLLLVTGLDNLQYAADNLFRRVHVVHCADTDHNNLQINQIS